MRRVDIQRLRVIPLLPRRNVGEMRLPHPVPLQRLPDGECLTSWQLRIGFAALIVMQAAHSVEEYVGRLWETFLPARVLSESISSDGETGFIVINIGLVLFGLWCLFIPVNRGWRSASGFIWFWIVIEMINGIGHPLWSLRQGGYTPGAVTAPILLVIALYLAFRMTSRAHTGQ